MFAEGKLIVIYPEDTESLDILAEVANDTIYVYQGVSEYSSYNVFSKDIVEMTLPPDSVSHVKCSRLLKGNNIYEVHENMRIMSEAEILPGQMQESTFCIDNTWLNHLLYCI